MESKSGRVMPKITWNGDGENDNRNKTGGERWSFSLDSCLHITKEIIENT
jgi:hypothetical protein